MAKKSDVEYIKDILSHMEKVENFIKDCHYEEFIKNELIACAVIRCIEVIGEAVKNLSKELTEKYPEIPWSKMAKMRDFLIHQYHKVSLKVVWETVKEDIPQTKPLIEK
ncbi:MAG: DUF86 domain-containing protein, partial [Aquificaceae bacterium]